MLLHYTGDESTYNQTVALHAGSVFTNAFHVVDNIRKLPKMGGKDTSAFQVAYDAAERAFKAHIEARRAADANSAGSNFRVDAGKENASILAQPPLRGVSSPLKTTGAFAALSISSAPSHPVAPPTSSSSIEFGSSLFEDDDF